MDDISPPFYASRASGTAADFVAAVAETVDIAFQPVVNTFTGRCFGVEALVRGFDRLGFADPHALFDHAWSIGALGDIETVLHDAAIKKFAHLPQDTASRLFLNIDNRTAQNIERQLTGILEALGREDLNPATVCVEISERHELGDHDLMRSLPRGNGFSVFSLAIDDFGSGYSGFKLLYMHQPNFVKIDRFFISGIPFDPKKKLFVSRIVGLAQSLGITVVAEGVETREEFLTCREIGCSLSQGYYIQEPQLELSSIRRKYVDAVMPVEQRSENLDKSIIETQVDDIPALPVSTPMLEVFSQFRENKQMTFFPVIDDNNQVIGLVREENLKELTYSPYGRDLIANKTIGKTLSGFVSTCPIADINSSVENILQIFSSHEDVEGIILVDNFSYCGFLSARSLLHVINEKNLTMARDQNPLSKLPGNVSIMRFLAEALESRRQAILVYFDFDNFKPFNDYYGFRQGDRAISLFAQLMRKTFDEANAFLGHVGGDDFFLAIDCIDSDEAIERVGDLGRRFSDDVVAFYDDTARRDGGIEVSDRHGVLRKFPFLTVSTAVVIIRDGQPSGSLDDLTRLFSWLKRDAKASPGRISVAEFAGPPPPPNDIRD